MSSPAQGGPSVPKEKEKRFSKMLTRVKTVLKKASDPKRLSTQSKAGPSTAAPAPDAEAPASKAKETKEADQAREVIKVPRTQIYEERAKKLGERFGLEIKPNEWYSTEGHALRIEKPIRMRVHRECHKCGHTFGLSKACPSCKHPRCKECQRRPPKRTEAERDVSRKKRAALQKERAENLPILADWDLSDKRVVLKRPSKSGGQDLVHRKPRQRVRRTCCQCQKFYKAGSKTCEECQHIRCTDCPRDPPKKDRFPYGYPGDEFGAKAIPHYACHECKEPFPPNATGDTECVECAHKKCPSCQRITPRKVEPVPDPELWKAIQQKLDALKLK